MRAYTGTDYESCENCFKKWEHVKSRMVYGDPDAVPNPWLTLIIPTYRRADLLKEAIDSVIRQWHVAYQWDIVVVDNEPDDGKENDTERLIRSYKNKRILYYRNTENLRPGDNFNRCFLLARGKWVMMLHDDDLLVENTMYVMDRLIHGYENMNGRPLGAILATYIQAEYDSVRHETKEDLKGYNDYLVKQPVNYQLYKLTHNNVKVLSHIGGSAPTNGSTFLRKAVIDAGGFNEDFGISGDLILYYNLENTYNVFQSIAPLGFYRWGINSMMKKDSLYRVIRDNYDFREFVYKKHPLIGTLFRRCHYQTFSSFAIRERQNVSSEHLSLSDYDEIYDKRPNPVWYFIYNSVICRLYVLHKRIQQRVNAHKASQKASKYYDTI